MNIRALETLVRIGQVTSFSKAAALQNMTLSALSMQMKTLENDLGAKIFDRASRPPLLTPLGRRIADQAGRVLRERDNLKSMAEIDDPLVGNYRVGFIQSASVRILPSFLSIVEAEAPFAQFQVRSGLSEKLSNHVATGLLDAAVVTKVQGSIAGLRFDLIASEDMAIAIPGDHQHLETNALSQALPFIHFMPSTGIGQLIASAMHDLMDRPEKIIILDSIEATMECVKNGLGYTILPRPDIFRYADDGVYIRDVKKPFPQRDLVLVTKTNTGVERWQDRLFEVIVKASGSLVDG
ncbi:LysR family transcriptional regulator (plasmid) [Parasedimentitalea marina]|uniref:LysR family transcriptional regulator n=1 Tax=Parasedimentitalea marina TaxID=2483033 RepID=A0A3T0N9Z5_9RHOB|nr:LysR family transcriptional regulator [Parasedimentitalea marina]AZV80837.1 LysR family transcriptional regulator [Parasedimentitalea marina]